jgi:MFS family permease
MHGCSQELRRLDRVSPTVGRMRGWHVWRHNPIPQHVLQETSAHVQTWSERSENPHQYNKLTSLQVFYCAAPLSGAFGGLLATGLAEINFGGYNRWPWIFFVEGSLTIIVAIAAFFFLPDTPGKAKFLSEEEQWYIVHVLRADLQGAAQTDKIDDEKFSWAAVSCASVYAQGPGLLN